MRVPLPISKVIDNDPLIEEPSRSTRLKSVDKLLVEKALALKCRLFDRELPDFCFQFLPSHPNLPVFSE